ncbi:amidohydrolase family protein [Nocardioides sp. LMS-CY]|uniref:adenine deaminase C-terminal domain-containing protein n=1 Tax=Nocardioides sp. (strain LMS-CY) TaxID=2840457 RepID=UPI001C007EA5|nr:adenine deaminase C-terminal domain-containing protein [Nocardioides sp. LMS-CY]QWF20357.1 amidohydrolase family protein [Nocardioides sp. LMS-CY]
MKAATTTRLEREAAAAVAAGRAPADLVLTNARIVNVHTGRIQAGGVAVVGPRIAAVGSVDHCIGPDTTVVDAGRRFLAPGFIDSHIHLGGSQLVIRRLADVLVPRGTIALGTDFYEIATIAGREAVLHELEQAERSALDVLFSPAIFGVLGIGEFGNPGRFSWEDLFSLLDHPACVEFREWNCWSSWLPMPQMRELHDRIIERGLTVGGHLEGLSGPTLQASVALGAVSDHETATTAEALERVGLGLTVQIRSGSAARDFDALVPAITEHGCPTSAFAFCTDEQELADMASHGHLDRLVRQAVAAGIGPVEAITMASLTSARSMGVDDDYGSVQPGKLASFLLVDDLRALTISSVYARGRLVAEHGQMLAPVEPEGYGAEARALTVVTTSIAADDFCFGDRSGTYAMRVVGVTEGSLITEERIEDVELKSGRPDRAERDLATIAVIDRHEGGAERFTGLISGLRIRRGALAATVNPGMMNLMVLGVDEEDMAIAARTVADSSGGLAVVVDGTVVAHVPLPIYGILTDDPTDEVVAACQQFEHAIETEMGSDFQGLVSAAGFTLLAVSIPSLKITSRGLVHVVRGAPPEGRDLFVADPDLTSA